ncbi:MAG: hypothetical protein SGARI_002905, partial [Bacillariaceae sp.]
MAGYFLLNLVKTIFGSALLGYGVATLRNKASDTEGNDDGGGGASNGKERKNTSKNSPDDANISPEHFFNDRRLERYISSAVMIGVGLYFALPSLMSQMLWESAIPALTATETIQGVATDSVIDYIRSWKPETTGLFKTGGGGGTKPIISG